MAGLGVIGFPYGELGVILLGEFGKAGAVTGIVAGFGWLEGIVPLAKGGGIDQEQVDELELNEKSGEVGTGLLDAKGELSLRKLLAQFEDPVLQGVGFGGYLPMSEMRSILGKGGDVDFLVRAINANEGCVVIAV